ncbi:HAMP domain-containing histidine kinase [Ectobacillus sp. JY-23]|uniref:sensor histidine kinase n=1 Tax=Ectobacillus sp. JY-23 TaxID=2933872 RepID=UPI001FF18D9D|nr:HAMP domain-containing sensor histidine kinase [Ectobacillus sp. JY-23]UOY91859.1 HAMP domain-containing histidine kinase [Ectobacillus sp. JY-23]
MSIKTKFLLSYIVVICISIILMFAAGFLILFTITGDAKSVKYFYKNSHINKPLSAAEESAYLDLKFLAKHTPNELLDMKHVENRPSVEVVIRKGHNVTYASSPLNRNAVSKALPDFEEGNIRIRDTMQVNDTFYTYVKFDFFFPDNEEGSIFVLRKISSYTELVRNLFPILFGLLLLFLIVTLGAVNYIVSRSIIRPLLILKRGTERIWEGDLNFKLYGNSQDEVGQLTQSFEEMRKKLKESIELQLQYEESRKELLSNISHDLKTPITSIIGYVEGIRDGIANTKEKMDKYLTTIYTKAKDLDALIEELFLFSKLDLQRIPFVFEKVNISQYVQDYAEELQLDLQEQGIEVIVKHSCSTPIDVELDREKIKRVFSNLVHNSVKYMEKEQKQIQISLHEDLDAVTVQVSDNGPGIHSAELPYIFERFYRVEQSRSKQTGGSGLGLAIAKQIVQGHGGTIWANSEEGKGLDVFFTLPKAKREDTV